jgi:hypothetical protein
MATHDFRQLCSVRRTTGRSVDHLGRLVEELRTYRGWRNHTKRPRVLIFVVIKAVNGSAWNT